MGIIERLGRVADTYVGERDQLIEAEQEEEEYSLAMHFGLKKYYVTP